MFDNSKLGYVIIKLGSKTVEGCCSHWEIPGGRNYIKLVVDGSQYITSIDNVLLMEDPNK